MKDTLEDKLAHTKFIVEANSFERHKLWEDYYKHNPWKQDNSGFLVTVGYVYEWPIVISVFWATINDVFVLFYHPTSKVVDWDQISFYFETKCKDIPSCDANNFHQCIQFTKELNNVNN